MEKYVTILYMPSSEDVANKLADSISDKKVETHICEKVSENMPAILADIKKTFALIIVQTDEDYDYRDYLKEIVKCKAPIIVLYKKLVTYQSRFTINEIEYNPEHDIEEYSNRICCILASSLKIRPHFFNRKKYKNEAISLFNEGSYVWALGYFLNLFKQNDITVKEKIGQSYKQLMAHEQAINYYSICLPLRDSELQGQLCYELGVLYTQTRNIDFAEKYLNLAIENGFYDAIYYLGYLYETAWSYDSKQFRNKEAYNLYAKVLENQYTSEEIKALAKEKLVTQADKLMKRKNYAIAMTYYRAVGDGAKVAECLRDIKLLKEAYLRKKSMMNQQTTQQADEEKKSDSEE